MQRQRLSCPNPKPKNCEIKADIESAEASSEVAIAKVNQGEIQLRSANDFVVKLNRRGWCRGRTNFVPSHTCLRKATVQPSILQFRGQNTTRPDFKTKQRLLAQHENQKALEIKKQVAELDLNRTDVSTMGWDCFAFDGETRSQVNAAHG